MPQRVFDCRYFFGWAWVVFVFSLLNRIRGFVHIQPNLLPVMLSGLTIGFNNAVLAEASMSYLGIGVQPPDASLGSMLSEAQSYLFTAPWDAIFPGLTIVLLILGMGLIGEGIRERMGEDQ